MRGDGRHLVIQSQDADFCSFVRFCNDNNNKTEIRRCERSGERMNLDNNGCLCGVCFGLISLKLPRSFPFFRKWPPYRECSVGRKTRTDRARLSSRHLESLLVPNAIEQSPPVHVHVHREYCLDYTEMPTIFVHQCVSFILMHILQRQIHMMDNRNSCSCSLRAHKLRCPYASNTMCALFALMCAHWARKGDG